MVVPGNIGVDGAANMVSPLHTHEPVGVIHVESQDIRNFTLGQFFTLWGVPLDGAKVTVNDKPMPDPAGVVFENLALITVVFGEAP